VDGLRGLALLAVMGIHTGPPVLRGGFLGVDLFFVLSDFLVTYLLVREWQKFGSIRLRQFYLRRALRLCPALWAMLLVFGLATLTFGTGRDLDVFRRTAPSVLLYFYNWRNVPFPGGAKPTVGGRYLIRRLPVELAHRHGCAI
jgi:peptidoglycan/LPS O-acetylase OafA/YrhL